MDGIATQTGRAALDRASGIIFLLDDVIFDKQDWLIPAITFAAERIGLDCDRVSILISKYIEEHGQGDAGLFNYVLLSCGQSDSVMNIRAFNAWVNRFTPISGSIFMYPGVRDALKLLHERFELALLAEGPADSQRARLAGLNCAGMFHQVVYSDEIDGMKSRLPDDRAINALQRRMRSPLSETLFVGNNPRKHFTSTQVKGYTTIRVLSGEYAHVDYEPGCRIANFNLSSVARLPELLGLAGNLGAEIGAGNPGLSDNPLRAHA